MGWFDEQIKKRVKKDNELFSDAFIDMSSVVMGSKTLADSLDEQSKQAHDAINVILRYYHITPQEIPISITEVSDQLDFLLRPTGIMRRDVTLSGTWFQVELPDTVSLMQISESTLRLLQKTVERFPKKHFVFISLFHYASYLLRIYSHILQILSLSRITQW